MTEQNEIKFPLSKKVKAEFVDKYEKIYMRKPVHNITDEKLVEMVNSHPETLKANEGTQSEPKQEGIQNEEGQISPSTDAAGNETGSEGNDNNESGNLSPLEKISADIKNGEFNGVPSGSLEESDEAKAKAQAEREYQFGEHERLYGNYPDSNLSTDEIAALNLTKENLNEGSKIYFDLFGKQPLPDMTSEQIFSSVAIEQKRQDEAKAKGGTQKPESVLDGLEFDPSKEMLIVSKKDKTDKRVINKATFEFLKGDYDAVVSEPKELQNFKK